MKNYHNTTNLTGEELKQRTRKALYQNKLVLGFYKHRKSGTPWRVYRNVIARLIKRGMSPPPITSIRRSISNLKKQGVLEKTDRLRKGPMGAKEHIFTLKK